MVGSATDFDLELHALNRLSIVGVTFRTRTLAEVREIVARMKKHLWRHVETGELALPIDCAFPLAEAAEALDHMASNKHFGKLLLKP